MQIGKWRIALLLCCVAAAFEIWHLRHRTAEQRTNPLPMRIHEPSFALLPESEVATYAERFTDPKSRLESWEPTVADINDLESNLPQIAVLSEGPEHIEHPDQFFRQYLAVVTNGWRTIFVNALCTREGHTDDWRKRLVYVRDGGKCFWHATYDPATQKFSYLEIDGHNLDPPNGAP